MHLLDKESAQEALRRFDLPEASKAPRKIFDGADSTPPSMDHLDALEAQSIYILREAFARLKKLAGG